MFIIPEHTTIMNGNSMIVIIQNNNSKEARSILEYCAITDDIKYIRTSYDDLQKYAVDLKAGAMPVGSVEFVQKAFEIIGIDQPQFNPYSNKISWAFKRTICKLKLSDIYEDLRIFVKPVELKRFNGFVFKGFYHGQYDQHDSEQIEILETYSPRDWIYCSSIVNFVAEWRCYVIDGKLIASCRYDDNDMEFDLDNAFVNDVLRDLGKMTVAVDVGLTDDGKFCVVELNDAWAIGHYSGLSSKEYFQFLFTRWQEIALQLNNSKL